MTPHFKNTCRICGKVEGCDCKKCDRKETNNICVKCWENRKK